MKRHLFLAFATLAAAACAGTPGPIVEAGYPTGSLAVAAIERGDWVTAERLLTQDSRLSADDPARLINLGRVYMETGRPEQAAAVWQHALAASNHREVETLSGRTASTEEIARDALAQYQRFVQTAAR